MTTRFGAPFACLAVAIVMVGLAAPPAAGQDGISYEQLLKALAGQAQANANNDDGAGGELGNPDAPDKQPGPEQEVTVSPLGTVEMHVSDLPLATVLHLLCLESQRNIIASPTVSGTVTASLYDVTFDEALQAVLHANGAGYVQSGKFYFVYTHEELAEMELAAHPPETRVFRLNYIKPADAKEYLTGLLSDKGTIAASADAEQGIASSADDAGGDNAATGDFIIVTDRPEILERVGQILAEVDQRPQQVLIEATILRAQLSEANQLGIDFAMVGGVNLQMLDSTSTGIQDLTLGELPPEEFGHFNVGATTDFTGAVDPGGLTLGIIKDNVGMFLRALESVTDTTVLANPKVLALNKQRGQVIVGRRDGFLTTTVTETQAIQTVEFLETGTTLIFRPYIGNDGFVRVELHPEDSVGLVNAQGLPTEQTTEVTTNVIVRDGHTILIGGLFRDVTTDARSQLPGLGNLPGVGQLFRSNADSVSREEVIILLTLHVVKDDDAYCDASLDLREDLERMRVGLRRGMMWLGRGRLAQAHYHRAVEHYSEGHPRWALWELRLALHNQARFDAALRLREKIRDQRPWEDDGTAGRGFIWQLIGQERGVTRPDYGRPGPPFADPE